MTALATAKELEFTAALVGAGFFLPSRAAGVSGRGAKLTRLLLDLSQYLSREFAAEQAETLGFPPLLPRSVLDRVGYLQKFPQLLGSVCCFEGGAREHEALLAATELGTSVISHLVLADVALTPAACYPVYPTLTGTLPDDVRVVDVEGWCYRQEPSESPTRLRCFQMRELVCAGTPQQALAFRDRWVDRGLTLLRQLGLPAASAPASDPFFGSSGRLLTATQKEQHLKLELLVDVGGATPCAVMSANCHKDMFGELFAIRTQDGSVAHTACVGFGLERVALALLYQHGLDLTRWPAVVRQCLSSSL
jgi:seryl-tRNA synthetase